MSHPEVSRKQFMADDPVAVLGSQRPVALAKVLRVMQQLTWLESECAQLEVNPSSTGQGQSHWNDYKEGMAEALYRDRQLKRANSSHRVQLRLDHVFGSRHETLEHRWQSTPVADRAAQPRYVRDAQKVAFDARIRTALSQAEIGVEPDGRLVDGETERILQSAIQYHCAGGCYNVAYATLPLKNDDILEMLRFIKRCLGAATSMTIWNPNRQPPVLAGEAEVNRQNCGTVGLATYIEVWTNLRQMLRAGPEAREQVLRRLGGNERTRWFAQYGIDLDDPAHALVVSASLRRYCPPRRNQCQSRMRLTHSIQPAQFVELMQGALVRNSRSTAHTTGV